MSGTTQLLQFWRTETTGSLMQFSASCVIENGSEATGKRDRRDIVFDIFVPVEGML